MKICDYITENEGTLLNDLTCGQDGPGNMDEARNLAAPPPEPSEPPELKDGASKH